MTKDSETPLMETTEQIAHIYGCSIEEAQALDARLKAGDVEFDEVVAVVDRITDVQKSIDKTVEIARRTVRSKRSYLDYLMHVADAAIRALSSTLKPGKRTLRLGTAGMVQFAKTGGFFVEDREVLVNYLNVLSDEGLAALKVKRALTFRSEDILNEVARTGEVLPGIGWRDIDEHGSYRIGASKPWSVRNLAVVFKKALTGTDAAQPEDDDEGDE